MPFQRSCMLWPVVAFAGLACVSCASRPDSTSTALDWHPQLDQPIQQLEEVLAATEQQQPMNYTSANLAFVLDAKLYLLFERYLASAPAEKHSTIMNEQHQWLGQRKRATDVAYSEYEGGTFASFAGNRAYLSMTKYRIREIEHQMGTASATTRPNGFVLSDEAAIEALMDTKYVADLQKWSPVPLICFVEISTPDERGLYLGEDQPDHTVRLRACRVTADGRVWVNTDQTLVADHWVQIH